MTASIEKIEKLVNKLGDALKLRELKLATAESCTGGGLSYWLTSIPGSSNWFERGFVTYSDASKVEVLGVNPITIYSFGAVSEPTAREMAEGALQKSDADVSIAITGVAGPTGGSPSKPVGTVWFALAMHKSSTQTYMDLFSGDRQEIRTQAIKRALENILKIL